MLKTRLITGGSRGIGASIATLCSQIEYRVIITYKQQSASAEKLVEKINNNGNCASVYQLDITDPIAVEKRFKNLDKNYGTLGHLVNNVSIVALASKRESISPACLQKTFSTNVFRAFYSCQQTSRRILLSKGEKGGSIVNIPSIASRIDAPHKYVDYTSAKTAVDSMTMGIAKEYAIQGAGINCVRPGIINTDINTGIHTDSGDRQRPQKLKHLIPLQRPGEANKVAKTHRWLLSDKASYISGITLDTSEGC